jgi:O-Antigen ligase
MDSRLRRLLTAPGQADSSAATVPAGARRAMLVVIGLGCGASPAFFGYFNMTVWGPLALLLIASAIGLLLARPAMPRGIAAVAMLGLLFFAGWSLLSMGWAESADRALTEGDRWILYGVFLLLAILLIGDRRDGEVFLFSTVLAVLGVAAYDLIRMLAGDGPSLFGGSRLLEPLGYVNGLGGYFLLGFWPLVAVAERARGHALAGLAAGAATLLAALVLLTESRGTVFAFAASALVVLALLPGRNRRAWLLLVILAGLGTAWGPLTDVTQNLPPGRFAPGEESIQRAAQWSLIVAAGVAVVWGLGSWAIASLRDRSRVLATSLPRLSAAFLCGIALVLAVAGAVAVNDPVGKVSDQYEAFTELETSSSGSRFTSGGGNRYDYWRIAWGQFTDNPLDGIGAGNFNRTYFLERRTTEDVRQAHSIELQTLGDTGIVGALALGSFFVAVFTGLWRRARAARRQGAETGLTVAAAGVLVVWLAQTSVDWLHLIPGVTGIALGAAAILLLRPNSNGETAMGLRSIPPLGTVVVLVLAVIAIVFIGRPTLAEHLRAEAQDELRSHPVAALDTVEESLSLNPDAVQAYYVKAAALARLDAYLPAKATLAEAIRREPHNYVSWALLGDLATRRGDISAALRAYGRAASLNPRDRELELLGSRRGVIRQLHRDPAQAAPLLEAGT